MVGKKLTIDAENLIKIAIHNFEKTSSNFSRKYLDAPSNLCGYRFPLRTESW